MEVILYLLILLLGMYIGSRDNLKLPLLNYSGKIQNYALLFLLFVMGVKIGLDEEIIYSFTLIGLQGLVLAISSIIFSVLGVKLVSKKILHQKGSVENDL